MSTQIATTTSNNGAGFSTNEHVALLCDGSLVVADNDGTVAHLYQVTTPTSSPSTTSVTTFDSTHTPTVPSLYVLNNGTTTSDVWVAYGSNSANTGFLFVAHGTYTASGSTWSWDNTGTKLTTTAQFVIPAIVWTGTTLIVVYRFDNSTTAVKANSTTTKNGSAGWGTEYQLSGPAAASQTHGYPALLHDATNSCTLAVYTAPTNTAGQDTVRARVIADGTAPTSQGNWSAEATLSGNINVGAANLTAALDPANKNLHVAWCDSVTTPNPKYVVSTYTTSAVTAGTSFAITGGGGSGAISPMLALSNAASPTAYLLWASAAAGSAGDISYVTIASPYASGNVSGVTNLTNASANDNVFPQVPRNALLSGYVPLVYQFSATSAFSVRLDTSLTIAAHQTHTASGVTAQVKQHASHTAAGVTAQVKSHPSHTATGLTAQVKAHASHTASGITAQLSVTGHHTHTAAGVTAQLAAHPAHTAAGLTAQLKTHNTHTATGITAQVIRHSTHTAAGITAQLKSHNSHTASGVTAQLSVPSTPGTGIGDLAVTTKSQTWSGGPTGSPGTETDVTYTDATNSGWALGIIPSYGGMLLSPWYAVNSGTTSANQTSLTTSVPDGGVHWLDQSPGAVFAGSEDVKFANAGGLTEIAPAGTVFRRYYKGIGDTNDANGFAWTVWACIYPGDPGLVALRFDLHNPSGSPISLNATDSLEIALIGGLQQSDSTWAAANGRWNTLAGTEAAWASTLTNGEPDYAYITPANGGATNIGRMTVKHTSLSGLGWSSLQTEYLANASRLKFKVQGAQSSVAAGATQTVYALYVLRRNLNSADALAIAADYLNPGTPTASVGSYTSYSYDERAYVHAASGSKLTTTLDLSPAHVTARYKPIIKLTGWNTGGTPVLTWGGASLTAGSDYRYVVDTANGVLYVQLYYDVVASGATAGQRNNAALAITHGTTSHTASGVTAQLSIHRTHTAAGVTAQVQRHVAHTASGLTTQLRTHPSHTASGITAQLSIHTTHTASGVTAQIRQHTTHTATGITAQLLVAKRVGRATATTSAVATATATTSAAATATITTSTP